MDNLENIITKGLVKDAFKSEQALNVYNFLAQNSKLINSKEENISKSFGYLQQLSKIEFVISLARIYDKSSLRNKTRCFESAIEFIINKHDSLGPQIDIEENNQLKELSIPDEIIELLDQQDKSCFNLKLGLFYKRKLEINSNKISKLKTWRDKLLAHNEDYDKVVSIAYTDVNDLLDLVWNFISVIGLTYLNQRYSLNGDITIRFQTKFRSFDLKKLFDNI